MRASLTIKHSLILILSIFGLSACGGDMDDLDQYINETKAKPRMSIRSVNLGKRCLFMPCPFRSLQFEPNPWVFLLPSGASLPQRTLMWP